AEVRRQRAAFRRGVLRAAAVATVLLAVVGGLAGLAIQRGNVARERLVRMNIATGNRLVDDWDLLGALPWFVEALRLDAGNRERESIHRLRIAATLDQCPKILQLWFHRGGVNAAVFSPDGRRALTAGEDGKAQV